ncbi:MAG: hypothetical protein KAH20_08615 [Methylococcales bacterium]|nr:hypothetical protein [Methylococcales bacterium]
MKSKLFVLLLLVGNSFSAYALNSFNNYLLAAKKDVYDIEFGNSTPSEMNLVGAWFEEAQFRINTTTPTDNVDIKKNYLSYEVRVKPKAWGQKNVEENIIRLRKKQFDNNSQKILGYALQNRYLRLLDYFDKQNTNKYLLKLLDVLNQEKKIIKSQVRSVKFNPKKLLDIEDTLKQVQDKIKINQTRFNMIQIQLGLPLDNMKSLKVNSDIFQVVSLPEIKATILTSKEEGQLSPEVSNIELQLQLSQSQSKLIKTKQQLGVNMLKFEYGDQKQDEMSFEIGVNIPLGTSFRDTENQYKLHETKLELNADLSKIKQSLSEISNEITWLSEEFDLQNNQIKRVQKYLWKEYVKTKPLLIIALHKKLVEYKQKKVVVNQKALALYVRHMTLSGKITQYPLRNWIQVGTPELSSQVY